MTEPETTQTSINLSNEKLWNVLCHLSPLLGLGLILPLIVYLITKEDTNSSVPVHAKEALNFHITLFLAAIVSAFLTLIVIGIFLLMAVALAGLVFGIIAAIKASNGEVYKYPFTLRLVK